MAESSVYQLYRRIGDDIINSHERDLIIIARKNLYDRLSKVLTDYDDNYCEAEDLYKMLVEIQNAWEDTITCQTDISNEQEQSTEILSKYPSLKEFAERMSEVADDILSKAVAKSSETNRECEVDINKYNIPGEPIIDSVLLENMLTDSGMIEDSILYDEHIQIILTEQATNTRYRECYDANSSTELEIICAKHALWIYGEPGGERTDFSNCLLQNVNLSNCNLCSADFSGATFINCRLGNASMCNADFTNTKFKRCSLRHFTAEEADFKNSDFYNCDLRGAYFTHSNFTNAKIADCNFHETSFMNCCLESWICTDCNLNIANMTNVNYLESDWLSEANEEISMGGM